MKDRFQELIMVLTLIPFLLLGGLLNLILGEGWEDR